MPPSWLIDDGFEREKALLLKRVDRRRWKVLRIFVHRRSPLATDIEPLAEAGRYAEFLGAAHHSVKNFEPVAANEVIRVCSAVALCSLSSTDRQMDEEAAGALAALWVSHLTGGVQFFVNGDAARGAPRPRALGHWTQWPLFHTDFEAGVLAVSGSSAGLFWNAEDS